MKLENILRNIKFNIKLDKLNNLITTKIIKLDKIMKYLINMKIKNRIK